MKKVIYLTLFLAIIIAGCQNQEIPSLWNIEGEVTMKDAEVASIITPLEGIKIYLLNLPFTMDTTTSWFSGEDILDSAFTDNEGLYSFKSVAPGDYVVFPGDSTKGYQFDWSESPDSIVLTSENTKSDYVINFVTPQPIPENSSPSFQFIFNSSGDEVYYSKANWAVISMMRKTRARKVYWDWGPKIGWGSWYWSSVGGKDWVNPGETLEIEMAVPRDASGTFYQYKDEFQFRFYVHSWFGGVGFLLPDPIHTFSVSGNDLHDKNTFDVNWIINDVEVERIY